MSKKTAAAPKATSSAKSASKPTSKAATKAPSPAKNPAKDAKKPAAKSGAKARPQNPALPLFFEQPAAVDLSRHKTAGLKKATDLRFAAQTNSLPIHMLEFADVARSYPIVYSMEEVPAPLAVVGLEAGNLFINEDGQWREGHHVPAYVRKYPFLLLKMEDAERFALCVDEAADSFAPTKPDYPFYDAKGAPTEMARQALDLCGQYQKLHNMTLEFTKAVKEAGLFEVKEAKIAHSSGRILSLGGFQVISDERWLALPDATYLSWRKKGWVDMVSLSRMSQLNWRYLTSLMR